MQNKVTSRPLCGGIIVRGLVLPLSVLLGTAACCSAQAVSSARAPLGPLGVASNVGNTCGPAIGDSGARDAVEQQLRAAGMPVARVHRATLVADIDCMPAKGRNAAAVHQCLALTESVSLAAESRATLATTWRKCQSFQCARGKCESAVRTGLQALAGEFTAQFRPASAPAKPAAAPRMAQAPLTTTVTKPLMLPTPSDAGVAAADSQMGFVEAVVHLPPPNTLRSHTMFYFMYISACIAVLLRWEYCKRRVG